MSIKLLNYDIINNTNLFLEFGFFRIKITHNSTFYLGHINNYFNCG